MARIVRSITHWTGGPGRATALDREHYHLITEVDGRIVKGKEEIEDNIVTVDGDYAAHTLHLNTGSAGFAMAGMLDAVESPFVAGPSPINEKQFEEHCKMLARFHLERGIPIERETCLTHAEVEPTLGVKQRGKWDITRLVFKPELRGALPVGDYMRSRVRAYAGMIEPPPQETRPTLRMGDRGAFVLELQHLLKGLRHFSGKLDGIYGRLTRGAVLAFQADAGLVADGIVGPMTWKALMQEQPLPDRDVDEAYLKERGSRTLDAADKGRNVVMGTGAIASAGTVMEIATGATEKLEEADTVLDKLMTLVTTYWPLLLALGACAVLYYYFVQIKGYRVEDAIKGRNLGR